VRNIDPYRHDMDNLRNGERSDKWLSERCKVGYTPGDIDPDGLRILMEAGFVWDSRLLAFERHPEGHPERPSCIEYGFLRDQKLLANARLSGDERVGQLQRLRILIQSMD
jgi:hypothetical protein